VPIALTAYYLADQGQLDLDEQITLTSDQIVGGTGSLQYNQAGTTYTIRDLSARALYDSDNTAANMLLRRVGGFERVNALLTDLGMGQTQAQRFLMDFAALQAGRDNLTSPADMARMMRMITQNEVIGGQELLDAMGRTVDQQKIPALLPENAVVANKTGVLPAPNGVEHDISVIQLPDGNEYILVVMGKNLPNNQVAINAIAEASSLIYEYEQQLHSGSNDSLGGDESLGAGLTATGGGVIEFGQPVEGRLDSLLEVHDWTFSGLAGDLVWICAGDGLAKPVLLDLSQSAQYVQAIFTDQGLTQ
jgi:beta-lactamase class A